MTLPSDFSPLLVEAEWRAFTHYQRLCAEWVDAGHLHVRWENLSPERRRPYVAAQLRVLSDPEAREAQAWMSQRISDEIKVSPGWVLAAAEDAAWRPDFASPLKRLCNVWSGPGMPPPKTTGAVLVACMLALFPQAPR
jgi:hypothetical protein